MDDGDAQQRMMAGFTDILEREYGRRNVIVNDNCIRLNYYPCKIALYVYDWNTIAYAFMEGEASCTNFPVDGSIYTMETLIRNTHIGPGFYVNAKGNLFVPNYPFMFKEDDLGRDGFVVSVLDRLADMADFNSFEFNEYMNTPDYLEGDIDIDPDPDSDPSSESGDGDSPDVTGVDGES